MLSAIDMTRGYRADKTIFIISMTEHFLAINVADEIIVLSRTGT